MRLLENDNAYGPVNIVAPRAERNRDFIRIFAAACHRKAVFRVPESLLRVALGEMISFVTASQRVFPKVILDTTFRYRYGQLELALRDLCRQI